MHNILTKLFRKRGIQDASELSAEEKQTFDEWQRILTKEEMTVADIKQFLNSQINIIENKWADMNTPQNNKNELIPYHTCYNLLLKAIDAPRSAREALEKNLIQLIK